MQNEQTEAFAYFHSHQAKLEALHAHAAYAGDAALANLINEMHAEDAAHWQKYIGYRGFTEAAQGEGLDVALRSGGEPKPDGPKGIEPDV